MKVSFCPCNSGTEAMFRCYTVVVTLTHLTMVAGHCMRAMQLQVCSLAFFLSIQMFTLLPIYFDHLVLSIHTTDYNSFKAGVCKLGETSKSKLHSKGIKQQKREYMNKSK